MLFVFYGTHTDRARQKAQSLISGLLQKRPEAALVRIDAESFDPSIIDELSGGQALFGNSYIAELVGVLAAPDAESALVSKVKELSESANIIILREPALSPKTEKALKKHAHTITQFEVAAREAPERFNAFSLGDALYAKKRKELWILLQRARLSGLSDEELLGSLWYSAKTLVAAGKENAAADAGVKPYPYQKAKAAARNYSKEERERLLDSLFSVQRDLRAGEGELSHLLERWVLSI